MNQTFISNTGVTQCAIPRRHAACRNAALSQTRFPGSAKCFKFGRLAKITFFLLYFAQFAQAQLYWSGTQNLAAGQGISDNIILNGNVTINVASGTATLNGVIGGNYSITKTFGTHITL